MMLESSDFPQLSQDLIEYVRANPKNAEIFTLMTRVIIFGYGKPDDICENTCLFLKALLTTMVTNTTKDSPYTPEQIAMGLLDDIYSETRQRLVGFADNEKWQALKNHMAEVKQTYDK